MLTVTAVGQPVARELVNGLKWRLIGPFRGGRAVAVAGVPGNSATFYFGSVNGGIWKTTDAGVVWTPIFDGHPVGSIGALAVAPSDPETIYAGTGESDIREDLSSGNGVYKSTDGGTTWKHVGLEDTRQISRIVIDPQNPSIVYAGALGHAYGPNEQRGVYKSVDGGAHWTRVLDLGSEIGVSDLVMSSTAPRLLFAGAWHVRRPPWSSYAPTDGPGGGLYRSQDAGKTWSRLDGNGLPEGDWGRVGVEVAPDGKRVYALIEVKQSEAKQSGLYRSDDGGNTWALTNADPRLTSRAWYFNRITIDPENPDVIYMPNVALYRFEDGGKTISVVRGAPGGDDYHQLWIDPTNSASMVLGTDQGTTISLNRGQTWSSWYNQPTAQFYHVTTDDQFPYRIYGAQQDNSTVSIASRSDDGRIGVRDFFSVAGCENAHIAVDPRNPAVTYGGCYTGMLNRYDSRTRQVRDIAIWLSNYDGIAAALVPFRFQWTFPVLLSPHDPKVLYVASQFVHRSTNEGASWEKISPDLTLHEPKTLVRSGGPIHGDMTGTEWYATIYALAESPKTSGLLWAGSDDGLIHIRQGENGAWTNVTPRAYGKYTRTAVIEPSHFDAGTAYVAATRYQLDDFAPYLWKTTDYGKTWSAINAGIPTGAYTRTIREDPVRRGLLYAGTEAGVYVSFDDGGHWESLQLNLPRASVRDLTIHGNDLIAATHGRAFWMIDDIASLRQLADSVVARRAFLFQPSAALRWFAGSGRSLTDGENPANGASVDYWLKETPKAKIALEFLDGTGTVIRSYASDVLVPDTLRTAHDSIGARIRKAMKDSVVYSVADSLLSTRPGSQRFVWDMRYPEAKSLKNTVVDEGTLSGPLVPPGQYGVRLIVDGDTLTRRFEIVPDPRTTSSTADLAAQTQAALRVRDRLNTLVEAAQQVEDIQGQLDQRAGLAKSQPEAQAKRVTDAATSLRKKFEEIRAELFEVGCHADQCTLDQPIKLYNMLLTLNSQIQTGNYAPSKQLGEVSDDLSGKVDQQIKKLRVLEDSELKAMNDLLRELGLPEVFVPKPKGIA